MLNKLKPKSEFSHNILTLMTGTAAAQAIPIAISPILTRIYSPEEFGLYALYFAVFSVFSVIITARYELAIMVPKKDSDAINIVVLSIIISSIISFVSLIIIIVFNDFLTNLFANKEISNWLYFIPFSLFASGIYQSFNYWNNRKKQYKRLAINKVTQTTSIASGNLSLGLVGATSYGLILGNIIGRFIATFTLIKFTLRNDKNIFKMISKRRIILNMHRYMHYPKYSTFASLLDSFSSQAPIFFISRAYEMNTVGFYSFTMRILSAPAGIISYSIGQVYFQKISIIAHENPKNMSHEIINTSKKLATLSIIIFLPIVLYGDHIFSFIFGEKWIVAGEYAKILSVALFIRFIVSPLSSVFIVTDNIKLGSIWQVMYFVTTISVMIIAIDYEFIIFICIFVVNEVFMYIIYYLFILYASRKYSKRHV